MKKAAKKAVKKAVKKIAKGGGTKRPRTITPELETETVKPTPKRTKLPQALTFEEPGNTSRPSPIVTNFDQVAFSQPARSPIQRTLSTAFEAVGQEEPVQYEDPIVMCYDDGAYDTGSAMSDWVKLGGDPSNLGELATFASSIESESIDEYTWS